MERLPARFLDDIALDEKAYKPDFEITAKYQAFSSEILRISLLGIGLYGFLLAHQGDANGAFSSVLNATRQFGPLIAMALLLFGVSAIFALAHGFCATKCLGIQLNIVRLLARLQTSHWTEEEKGSVRASVSNLQTSQRSVLRTGLRCLSIAAVTLAAASIMIAIAFAVPLMR